ncbi:MAG TPA: ABC transporter permease subunit [Gaiellaceae bacterium]|jgi:NitT/TauT family transport system permease protein|nr:ABC transporter permease subunit [Gaiellaceae bacterium]
MDRAAGVNRAGKRAVLLLAVAVLLWGLWEGFRALGIHYGWTRPFTVDATTMPHVHSMVQALFERPNPQAPLLIVTLLRAALFTAKEAALGFAMGAVGGFAIGAVLAHSRVLQRGFLPYVVASQTVPILAIAPMVVIWFTSVHVTAWVSVAVIASYLTFFPVAIATLRGLQAADHRALELMRSYAAGSWTVLWKLRFPTALPYLFSALKVSATASIVGAIIGESPSSIAGGLGGAILNFAQYYSFQPQNLWATNIIAASLGISFFLIVVVAEKLVVRRAPEHVA